MRHRSRPCPAGRPPGPWRCSQRPWAWPPFLCHRAIERWPRSRIRTRRSSRNRPIRLPPNAVLATHRSIGSGHHPTTPMRQSRRCSISSSRRSTISPPERSGVSACVVTSRSERSAGRRGGNRYGSAARSRGRVSPASPATA